MRQLQRPLQWAFAQMSLQLAQKHCTAWPVHAAQCVMLAAMQALTCQPSVLHGQPRTCSPCKPSLIACTNQTVKPWTRKAASALTCALQAFCRSLPVAMHSQQALPCLPAATMRPLARAPLPSRARAQRSGSRQPLVAASAVAEAPPAKNSADTLPGHSEVPLSDEVKAALKEAGLDYEASGLRYLSNEARVSSGMVGVIAIEDAQPGSSRVPALDLCWDGFRLMASSRAPVVVP